MEDIKEIEKVSAMGGFHYKEWVISGQDVAEQLISVHCAVTKPNRSR